MLGDSFSAMIYVIFLLHRTGSDLLSCRRNDVGYEEEALGQMSGQIVSRFFSDYYCVTVITESNNSAAAMFPHMPVNAVPIIHLLRDAESEANFEDLLLESLNQRCLAYIVQTRDLGGMVDSFNRMTRRAFQRISRKYLYLPTLMVSTEEWEQGIRAIFGTRALDFMPDLVVVRRQEQMKLGNLASGEKSFENWQQLQNVDNDELTIDLRSHNSQEVAALSLEIENCVGSFDRGKISRQRNHNNCSTKKANLKVKQFDNETILIFQDVKKNYAGFMKNGSEFDNSQFEGKKPRAQNMFSNIIETDGSSTEGITSEKNQLNDFDYSNKSKVEKSTSKAKLVNNFGIENESQLEISMLENRRSETEIFGDEDVNGLKFSGKQMDSSETIFSLQSSGYTFDLITHWFKGRDPGQQILLDKWVSGKGFLSGSDLYPDKLGDLEGKPYYITTLPYPPFAVLDIEVDPPVNDGFEFRVVNEFVLKHNMTYEGVYDLDNWWGEIWDNGSGNGLSGLVAEDRADVSFAAVYLWLDEYRFTDYSVTYGWSGITVVAPKPTPLPGLKVPLLPFSKGMWLAVCIYLVTTTLVLYSLSKLTHKLLGGNLRNQYSTLVECAFRTLGLFVLQVPDDERDQTMPRHVPMRHLVNWLILQFLVITTAYGGGLASVLTLPRFTPPIETASDLAASGLPWAALDDAFVFGIKESPDPVLRTLTHNFHVGTEEELTAHTRMGDMAFVVERLKGGRFALPPHITEESMEYLRLMQEDIFWGHCVFMMRKGTPHMHNFNRVVNSLREAGITLYWELQVVREYLSERQQLAVVQSRALPDLGPKQLRLEHVEGAYILLFLGLGIAFVSFLIERVTNAMRTKNQRLSTEQKKMQKYTH
ncbi:uncharacterized protein [Periplaneta americana]|uniref:uncharacterized protein n=1 Tax=Periplaneta americana TaxID=6978 RepID=UPI0037E7AD58